MTDEANFAAKATFAGLSFVSLALFFVGGFLAYKDRTSSAATSLGFAFLVAVLVLLAKFKRFKGFGFEAEMWGKEQVEAARLVWQLKAVAKTLIEQIALLAATIGLQNATLDVNQKDKLLTELENLASEIGYDRADTKSFVLPLIKRLCRDHCWGIDWQVEDALRQFCSRQPQDINNTNYRAAKHSLAQLEEIKSKVWDIDIEHMTNLEAIINDSPLERPEKLGIIDRIQAKKTLFDRALAKLTPR